MKEDEDLLMVMRKKKVEKDRGQEISL